MMDPMLKQKALKDLLAYLPTIPDAKKEMPTPEAEVKVTEQTIELPEIEGLDLSKWQEEGLE
jgi:hypothetical protein